MCMVVLSTPVHHTSASHQCITAPLHTASSMPSSLRGPTRILMRNSTRTRKSTWPGSMPPQASAPKPLASRCEEQVHTRVMIRTYHTGSHLAAHPRRGQKHHPRHPIHQCHRRRRLHPGGRQGHHHVLRRHEQLHDVRWQRGHLHAHRRLRARPSMSAVQRGGAPVGRVGCEPAVSHGRDGGRRAIGPAALCALGELWDEQPLYARRSGGGTTHPGHRNDIHAISHSRRGPT